MFIVHAYAAHSTIGGAGGASKAGEKAGLKTMLDSIGSIWDEEQYAEDLSLDAFMAKLKSE